MSENCTMVIRPRRGWLDLGLPELWRYRNLIMLFVRRDFVTFYKQTILGPLWFLIQPLLSTVVFTILFGNIARIPTDGIPPLLFYMSGIVTWNYFASCLTKTSETFTANAHIFGKVYFPRLTMPIAVVLTNLITFAIQFGLFLVCAGIYHFNGAQVRPSVWLLLLPLLLVQMAALGLGIGILVSSLTTKYRDLSFVVGFGVQLWMYATPVVYPLSVIPEEWRALYALNPMVAVIEAFRLALLGSGTLRPAMVLTSGLVTALLLAAGILLFNKVEKTFMDTV